MATTEQQGTIDEIEVGFRPAFDMARENAGRNDSRFLNIRSRVMGLCGRPSTIEQHSVYGALWIAVTR